MAMGEAAKYRRDRWRSKDRPLSKRQLRVGTSGRQSCGNTIIVVTGWGNGASVRIPMSVVVPAKLNVDEEVEVCEAEGRVVIIPIRPAEYRLADLIAGITYENRHEEVDFGPPVGKEILS
jgi:antitoxin MazE